MDVGGDETITAGRAPGRADRRTLGASCRGPWRCGRPRVVAGCANICSMVDSGEPTILHADLDAFYASVEQRDDPCLRGRPVLVGPGVVLSASYEARAFGVRTPMGVDRARRLCPDAVVVPARFAAYAEASRAVFGIFERTTP